MNKIKKFRCLLTILSVAFAICVVFAACDTDECFDKDNYKSSQIQKAAPGTYPVIETDC